MKKGKIFLSIVFAIILSAGAVQAANVAIGSFGYHPEQLKQAIVYTDSLNGIFTIYNADNNAQVFTGTLAKPKDHTGANTNCQGNQQCLVGDFSSLKTNGNYYVQSGSDKSPVFKISPTIFSERAPLFLEVFEAFRQQGSSYHANLHSAEQPPFPAMADGSFIMAIDQAAFAGIRLAWAYNRNPQLFSNNKYSINIQNAPDIVEQIKLYVEYVKGLQDLDGNLFVPNGYYYNFGCPLDYDPYQSRYTASKDSCLQWNAQAKAANSVQALLLYAAAIPAINQIEGQAAANALLDRVKRTQQHIKDNYPNLVNDDAAFYGAALFMLYDYTGEEAYLKEAHSQRTKINKIFDSEITYGREFFWEEYARHKQPILNSGLTYEVDGIAPEQLFENKILNDWAGWDALHAISRNGERVYILGENIDFQQSRFMLIEAITAAKAQDLAGENNIVQNVADLQLAWLTGMNQIQNGDFAGPLSSKSFIFGIGNFGKNQHVRLVNPNFFTDGRAFPNGMKYIPGWVSGSFDSYNDGDKIFNYHDDYWRWSYTETTNEIVAVALELSSYLDAKYNNKAPISRPRLTGTAPIICNYNGQVYQPGQQFPKGDGCNNCNCNSDGSISCSQNSCQPTPPPEPNPSCYSKVNDIPATCTASIIQDTKAGCRTIVCSQNSNSIKILACNKPDGTNPQYFEMYRQSYSGIIPKACIGDTCIQNEGYKKSPNYPICTSSAPPLCTPSSEICDGKDNNCNSLTDENSVCGPMCTPTNEICDSKDNNCNGQIDENNVCSQKCYSTVKDAQSTCTSTINQDTSSGSCRTISCGSGSNSVKVLSCDKPDSGVKQYFEMYRQSYSGTIPKVCLGTTCIQSNGYTKSSTFPICA